MPFTISQNFFVKDSTAITIDKYDYDAVKQEHLQPLLDSANNVLGVAAIYGKQCKLSYIAFSTLSRTIVINIPARHANQSKRDAERQHKATSVIQNLLRNSVLLKYAFKMDNLAVALFLDLSICINNAVDMLSVSTGGRHSLEALMNAMGGEVNLHKETVRMLLFGNPKSQMLNAATRVALEAWATCRAATLPDMSSRFAALRRVDTTAFQETHLTALANISRHADRLDALKPTIVKNDVKGELVVNKSDVSLICERFSNRVKKSANQVIKIEIAGTKHVVGRAHKINGRNAKVKVDGPVHGSKILSVTTIGKDNPTCAESARQDVILQALQHNTNVFSNPFFQTLWLPEERPVWPESRKRRVAITDDFPRRLNTSQKVAIRRILSNEDDDRIVMVQGPPGTGKTTVIAASVMSHANSSQCIWIAAQSNVAVKNIAEKLIDVEFGSFRLLVSKDFHFDWHEHLYGKELEECLIRSDSFKETNLEASRQLLGCKVILCTLSMLSNPTIGAYLRVVPVQMIILDEASQIECGDYLPVLNCFHSTLQKLVFIGDDKQLPPYGRDDVPEIRSVFEISHIRKRTVFLDTQYRMPHVIGNFISRHVYGGKLITQHDLTTPKACRFIDVNKGHEAKRGRSWINDEEARIVVKLAHLCEKSGKSRSLRIITPYDGQRSHIENLLKQEKLPWKDKVFNVDSFQGNEAEHIIISVVRSNKPGFLQSQRRTNVMLTRCKASMLICSSRAFLFGEGSETLVGKLAVSVGKDNWINGNGVLNNRVKLFV